jgi:4-hydroxybenzoate polyprenyltransferase
MINYDSMVLQEYAERLYTQASGITVKYALGFGVLCAAIGAAVSQAFGLPPLTLWLGIVGAVLGALVGQSKGFQYRLQAQTVLCQVQIEANTRAGRVVSA